MVVKFCTTILFLIVVMALVAGCTSDKIGIDNADSDENEPAFSEEDNENSSVDIMESFRKSGRNESSMPPPPIPN